MREELKRQRIKSIVEQGGFVERPRYPWAFSAALILAFGAGLLLALLIR